MRRCVEEGEPRAAELEAHKAGRVANGSQTALDVVKGAQRIHRSLAPLRITTRQPTCARHVGFPSLCQLHILDYDTPEGPKRLSSKSVVLTAPSYVTASLLQQAHVSKSSRA